MEKKPEVLSRSRLDQVGALLSLTCAVHCVALPFLILALPWIGMAFLVDRRVELLFIGCSMLLATVSFCSGFHLHRKKRLLMLLYFCTGMIVVGKVWIMGPQGLWLAVPGALGLAAGHLLNRRLCLECRTCHHGPSKGITAHE
ncbi:MAG TPA: MerC domain-containing protein [bacterium]|nr:MerC domain-containing protein [bacterium]